MERIDQVLVRPVISEKGAFASGFNVYQFRIGARANKISVKKAFLDKYHVEPISVRVINMPAKTKRFGRTQGVRPGWKKALVRVSADTKIDIYTGV